jgi:hypothetical protein
MKAGKKLSYCVVNKKIGERKSRNYELSWMKKYNCRKYNHFILKKKDQRGRIVNDEWACSMEKNIQKV